MFLQFAEKIRSKRINNVELSYQWYAKFILSGNYLAQSLGKEYSFQNPVYTMRTFPEHLTNPDGTQAYSEWSGGFLGVTLHQMEDFNDFHDKWYLR